ncbi:glycosyltransferase family 4 protein [Patescibacteria group bacterium]|nr:glycosyltransferase family 4 protein [Patescibacteria group bacterium]
MRILHVNKFFDLNGGAEVYMHDLMRQQAAAGHEVHILSTASPKNLPSKDASRFVIRRDLSIREGAWKDFGKAVAFVWNSEAEAAMDAALRDLKPEVVHLHNIYHHLSTSILAPIRKRGVSCVQTLHDLKLVCPNYRMATEGALCERCKGGRYWEAVKHRCLFPSFAPNALAAFEMGLTKSVQSYERTVRTFICPSRFMADKMIEWGEPASKMAVVRMPVLRRDPARRGGGYLLAVGRLSPEKGYEELILAAGRVPDVRIKIAGIGPLEERLREMMRRGRIENVDLVGFKRGDDLEALYREAEAFVACPVGYENAPLSVMDALGYGLPILATAIGGLPEMVTDGVNGFLVAHGNGDAWVEALKRFDTLSFEARDRMASESTRLINERFPTVERHLEQVLSAYRGT